MFLFLVHSLLSLPLSKIAIVWLISSIIIGLIIGRWFKIQKDLDEKDLIRRETKV